MMIFRLAVSGVLSQDIEDVEAADLGHHDVQQHQVRLVAQRGSQRFFPVGNASDVKALGLQAGYVYTGQPVVVLDQQNALGMRRRDWKVRA